MESPMLIVSITLLYQLEPLDGLPVAAMSHSVIDYGCFKLLLLSNSNTHTLEYLYLTQDK